VSSDSEDEQLCKATGADDAEVAALMARHGWAASRMGDCIEAFPTHCDVQCAAANCTCRWCPPQPPLPSDSAAPDSERRRHTNPLALAPRPTRGGLAGICAGRAARGRAARRAAAAAAATERAAAAL